MSTSRSLSGVRNYSSAINEGKAQPNFNFLWDASTVYTTTQGRLVTGAWRAAVPADFAANVSISGGITANVSAVAITGNPQVQVSNPIYSLAITGTPSVSIGNTPTVTISNPVLAVTGNFGSSSVAITGNPQVSISNVTLNVVPSGGFVGLTGNIATTVSNPVNSVAITGNPQVQISNNILNALNSGGFVGITGIVQTNILNALAITGSPNVTITNTALNPIPVSGNFGITGNMQLDNIAITGNPQVSISNTAANPIPVSGQFSLSGRLQIDNVAITGTATITEATGTFGFNINAITNSQIQIPAGALGYSIAIESGTPYINNVPIYSNLSIGGGGYGNKKQLASAINVGITGGRVIVLWEV